MDLNKAVSIAIGCIDLQIDNLVGYNTSDNEIIQELCDSRSSLLNMLPPLEQKKFGFFS